jgi:hypothetical protein
MTTQAGRVTEWLDGEVARCAVVGDVRIAKGVTRVLLTLDEIR